VEGVDHCTYLEEGQ